MWTNGTFIIVPAGTSFKPSLRSTGFRRTRINRAALHPSTGSGGTSAKRQIAAPGTPPPAMTSGNEETEAPTVTGSAPQNGENKPPQAIVKPQVLTHVIEGFVIQEGAEPFPVCVSGSAA